MSLAMALSLGIPVVVRLVEAIRGRGNGGDKKTLAVDIIKQIAGAFAGPGIGLPSGDELSAQIESVVAALNKSDILKGSDTPVECIIDPELLAMGLNLLKRSGALKGIAI